MPFSHVFDRRLDADDVSHAAYADVLRDYHQFLRRVTQGLLIVIGTFSLLRGLGYSPLLSPEKLPLAVDLTSQIVPLNVWSAFWVLSGLAAFIGAWLVRPAATLGVVILSFIWAVGYTASWIYGYYMPQPAIQNVVGSTSRDWLNASTYWTVCLLAFGGRYLALACLRLTQVMSPQPPPAEEFPPTPVPTTASGDPQPDKE